MRLYFEEDEQNINHTNANVYLELNKAAGEYFKKNGNPNPDLPEGWIKIEAEHIDRTNFKGVSFTNGDEYALVYLGTDVKNGKDWAANVKMSTGQPNKQCEQAVEFYNKQIENKNIDPSKVIAIGNSEGGREVIEVLNETDVSKGVTFNGYMRVDPDKYDPENFKDLVNYRTEKDIISKCGKTIGTDYIVPVKEDVKLKPVYDVIQSHRIDNIDMITNENAIPAEKYAETTGKNFKNKYGEGTLKSNEIGEIPKEFYPIVDPDVNERLKNGAVVREIENTINNPYQNIPDNIGETSQPSKQKPEIENLNKIKNYEHVLYKWNTEPGACKRCQELDGKIFFTEDEIPEIPHPNCKCQVEAFSIQESENELENISGGIDTEKPKSFLDFLLGKYSKTIIQPEYQRKGYIIID